MVTEGSRAARRPALGVRGRRAPGRTGIRPADAVVRGVGQCGRSEAPDRCTAAPPLEPARRRKRPRSRCGNRSAGCWPASGEGRPEVEPGAAGLRPDRMGAGDGGGGAARGNGLQPPPAARRAAARGGRSDTPWPRAAGRTGARAHALPHAGKHCGALQRTPGAERGRGEGGAAEDGVSPWRLRAAMAGPYISIEGSFTHAKTHRRDEIDGQNL
ncbi:hypothetical protein DFJ74DRAFT_344880 [Hyaloraphidium curvatum]|nr:hypothetical protein DFJ74DRAFT_344880 [Hyaloraphidium curvatum]